MTPEEILRDLRDIHLPNEAADAAGAGLVLWPAALVVATALIGIGLVWWRRSAWRREIAAHLERIEQRAGDGRIVEGWKDLAVLLRRLALGVQGRRDVAGLIGDAWLEQLDHLLQTDIFSRGPGRGVVLFPYRDEAVEDQEKREHMARDLETILDVVRKKLPRLRAVR